MSTLNITVIYLLKLLTSDVYHFCIFFKVCAKLQPQNALVSQLGVPPAALCAVTALY